MLASHCDLLYRYARRLFMDRRTTNFCLRCGVWVSWKKSDSQLLAVSASIYLTNHDRYIHLSASAQRGEAGPSHPIVYGSGLDIISSVVCCSYSHTTQHKESQSRSASPSIVSLM